MKNIPIVAIDQGASLKKLRPLQRKGLIKLQQARDIEQSWDDIKDHGQPFTIGVSSIGGSDFIAGDNIGQVRSVFNGKKEDFLHFYSASGNSADFFITENTNDFIKDGKREKLEQLTGIKIMTTSEFLDYFDKQNKVN